LPLFLFCAGFLALLNGQFGQPTNLGFAVFLSGLCLAAANSSDRPALPAVEAEGPRRIARRSRYAEQMHGSAARQHPDDLADR
jgi:hypothetical protein